MFDSIMNLPWIWNMVGLHMVLKKLLIIDIREGSEYAWSSKYASVTQGSVENSPPYSSGSQYASA